MVTRDLKVALIFGKKPVPRGGGEREGERERDRFAGSAKGKKQGMRHEAHEKPSERFGKGLWRKPRADPPARAGEVVGPAGFGRQE